MKTLDLRRPARARALHLPEGLAHLREAAAATWHGRMVNEHRSAGVFEALARQFVRAHMLEASEFLRSFAREERFHGVLCARVVEALGGSAVATLEDNPPLPAHRDASSAREAALRNLISVCCMSETVAVALIGAERMEMPEGDLRTLLTRIYADEVGHARFGWRTLEQLAPTLYREEREGLGEYLTVAFAHLVEHELAHLPEASAPPAEGAQLGLCSGVDARKLFFDTVVGVIVPGLELHGIHAARAWSQVTHVAA